MIKTNRTVTSYINITLIQIARVAGGYVGVWKLAGEPREKWGLGTEKPSLFPPSLPLSSPFFSQRRRSFRTRSRAAYQNPTKPPAHAQADIEKTLGVFFYFITVAFK